MPSIRNVTPASGWHGFELQGRRERAVLREDAHDRGRLEELLVGHTELPERFRAIRDRKASVVHDARGIGDELLVQAGDLAFKDGRDLAVEHDLRVRRIRRHVHEIAREATELLTYRDEDRRRWILRAHRRRVVEGGDRLLERVDAVDMRDRRDELD